MGNLEPNSPNYGPPLPQGYDKYFPNDGKWPPFLYNLLNPKKYTVTTQVSPSGSGQVTVSPLKTSYKAGDKVTITATPASGYQFDSFAIGSKTYSTNPLTLTIGSSITVIVTFVVQGGQVPANSFEIKAIHLPTGAMGWNCAIVIDDVPYQISNPTLRDGEIYLLPDDVAIFTSLPGSSGQLWISAYSGFNESDGGISVPITAQKYTVDMTFVNGNVYTFNFSTGQFT